MSDKTVKTGKKKSISKVFKWIFIILIVVILELGAIVSSVFISESRNSTDGSRARQLLAQIHNQDERLSSLEKIPLAVSDNSQQITATTRSLGLLSENLNALSTEVKNYQLDTLEQRLSDINHKIDVLDERSNIESLVLSVALMIKENALYHRDFSYEADILAKLTQNNGALSKEVEIINKYKSASLFDYKELANQYNEFSSDLSFETEETIDSSDKNTALSKSVKMLKDTVSNINFDKVIVLKKQKGTEDQVKLLDNLEQLVKTYNYAKALDYIKNNPEFNKIDNADFTAWQEQVRRSLEFEQALLKIISTQLDTLKQDVKQNNIEPQKVLSSQDLENTPVLDEDSLNDTKVD